MTCSSQTALAIGDDVSGLIDLVRPSPSAVHRRHGRSDQELLQRPGRRYGYAKEAAAIQDAYLSGRKQEAENLIPQDLLEHVSLIGPRSFVAERVAAMRESGVTTLVVRPMAKTHAARVALIGQIKDLVG